MQKLTRLFLMGCAALAVQTTHAQDQLVLDFNGQEYTGRSVIQLKDELQRAYPRLRARNLELDQVLLVAKSQFGRAEAELKVGRETSNPETIRGNPIEYSSSGLRSYDRVYLQNPSYDSSGVWQIHFNGRLKVDQVVVYLKDDLRPDRPNRPDRPDRPDRPGRPDREDRFSVTFCHDLGGYCRKCDMPSRSVTQVFTGDYRENLRTCADLPQRYSAMFAGKSGGRGFRINNGACMGPNAVTNWEDMCRLAVDYMR